jgi:NNP family nitrate/nitrite transporter-like MFS transporter
MEHARLHLKPVLFLCGVLTLNFLARMLLSPLLLRIEQFYGISHAEGGALFFFLSLGYSVSMLGSGFVAERLLHRGTVLTSVFAVGLVLLLLSTGPPLALFRVGLVALGVGAGLYGPSGIAMLTGVAQAQHWGKALAIHEVGPILGFFLAPVLAGVAGTWTDWRGVFAALGVVSLVLGIFFWRFAEGGRFQGARPSPRNIWAIWRIGRFWVVAALFVLAIGGEIGVYSMLPAFLTDARGWAPATTNSVVSVSRLTALALIFSSGFLADRFGARMLIGAVCLSAGLATLAIGLGTGALLTVAVLIQPMLIAAFFPAGLIELSKVTPASSRNLAIALVLPLGNLFGAGIVPAGMGYLAERGAFPAGFAILGGILLLSLLLLRALPPTERTP